MNRESEKVSVEILEEEANDEQKVLLACCLFDSFDLDLISQTTGIQQESYLQDILKKLPVGVSRGEHVFGLTLDAIVRKALLDLVWPSASLSIAGWRELAEKGIGVLSSIVLSADSKAYPDEVLNFSVEQMFKISLIFKIQPDCLLPTVAKLLETSNSPIFNARAFLDLHGEENFYSSVATLFVDTETALKRRG